MKDVTPDKFRCSIGACPAVYDLGDGNVLIIGKKAALKEKNILDNEVGNNENAIVIDKDMLSNVKIER